MTNEITERAEALRLALLDDETEAVRSHRNWLMGQAASALLRQDTDSLRALRAALAGLPTVADRFGDGKSGDRWRAVWELVDAFCETPRPLEQARLANASQVAGQILLTISAVPGIHPGDLVKKLGKTNSHISNVLRKLMEQGLVHRLTEGRSGRCFLTATGRQQVAAMQPETPSPVPPLDENAPPPSPARRSDEDFPHMRAITPRWPDPRVRPNFWQH